MIFIAVLVAGCATRGVPTTLEPDVAAGAVEGTAPDRPLRLVFEWTLRDGEARFTGDGLVRVAPEYRARLDLFGPRGESYVRAAVVGDTVRLPARFGAVPLPPAALMWAVLGVVAPPEGMVLAGTRVDADRTELHYERGEERLVYTLRRGRVRTVEWRADARMLVRLEGDTETGAPARAIYRDWGGNTELMLSLEEADEVDGFPPDTWWPDA